MVKALADWGAVLISKVGWGGVGHAYAETT